ncbi:hypothetical protein OROGR_002246 [Orobanche gracilis]
MGAAHCRVRRLAAERWRFDPSVAGSMIRPLRLQIQSLAGLKNWVAGLKSDDCILTEEFRWPCATCHGDSFWIFSQFHSTRYSEGEIDEVREDWASTMINEIDM